MAFQSNVRTKVEALLTRAQEHLNAAWALQQAAARLAFGVEHLDDVEVSDEEPVNGVQMQCIFALLPVATLEQAERIESGGLCEEPAPREDGGLSLASVDFAIRPKLTPDEQAALIGLFRRA